MTCTRTYTNDQVTLQRIYEPLDGRSTKHAGALDDFIALPDGRFYISINISHNIYVVL